MTPATARQVHKRLIWLLDEAYRRSAWHGPTLRSSVRGVSAGLAVRRPARGRRCIAEIVLHCAFTKNLVRRRVQGTRARSFPLPGSNWFDVPRQLSPQLWSEYLELLDAEQAELREAVKSAPVTRLLEARISRNIHGLALHDVYHAGQIRTLRALLE